MLRTIDFIRSSTPSSDGDGVALLRNAWFNGDLDPFLMLDEIKANPEDSIGAFPVHPHRGIQTLSYFIHGGMAHQDSMGNASQVSAGGIQWMHSGRGIEHAENPFIDQQGLWGFQFWLNVPHVEKFIAPQYLDRKDIQMPWQDYSTFQVKPVAGSSGLEVDNQIYSVKSDFNRLSGQASVIDLQWQSTQTIYIPSEQATLAIYVIAGDIEINELEVVNTGKLVKFSKTGSRVCLAGNNKSRALIFQGQPIGESIVHQGPFVMTSEQEIRQTIQDYRNGTLI